MFQELNNKCSCVQKQYRLYSIFCICLSTIEEWPQGQAKSYKIGEAGSWKFVSVEKLVAQYIFNLLPGLFSHT